MPWVRFGKGPRHRKPFGPERSEGAAFSGLPQGRLSRGYLWIRVLQDGFYSVSGGWFGRKGLSPLQTTIAGCTWGGSAIKLDIVAACGLHLEFGNRAVTGPIRGFFII